MTQRVLWIRGILRHLLTDPESDPTSDQAQGPAVFCVADKMPTKSKVFYPTFFYLKGTF